MGFHGTEAVPGGLTLRLAVGDNRPLTKGWDRLGFGFLCCGRVWSQEFGFEVAS